MPGHERRRTRPPEHKSLAVKKGYTQNPLAAAKARAAAAEAAEPKKVKKAGNLPLDLDLAGAADDAELADGILTGVGESVDDLQLFDLDLYLKTLVGLESR